MSAYYVPGTLQFHALFEEEPVGSRAKDSNHVHFCLTLRPKLMKREDIENTE